MCLDERIFKIDDSTEEKIIYSPEFQHFLDLWQSATKSNDPAAQFTVAWCLLKSKQNSVQKKSFSFFKQLAHNRYTPVQTDSQFMLATCYQNGFGIQKNYQRAIRWYLIAEKNISNDLVYNPDPIGEQASKTLEEIIKDKDLDEAIDEVLFGNTDSESIDGITEAAEEGNIEAQKYLMSLYNLGSKNISCDKEKEMYWVQKAAESRDIEAMTKLGCLYYYGDGVEKDIHLGLYWLQEAAKLGSELACKTLGDYCQLQKQYKEAAAWYRLYTEIRIKWRNKRLGWNKKTI